MLNELNRGPGGAADPAGTAAEAARLEGMSPAAAVATLPGNGADDKPPALDAASPFPGPVAEAFFWSDADVIGIQGPVGSGKTQTLLRSRLRRAIAMPRSAIDGVRRYRLTVTRETYRQLWSTTIPDYLSFYPKHFGTWSGGRGAPVQHDMAFDDGHGPIEFSTVFLAFGDDIVASMRGLQTTDLWLAEMDTNPVEVLALGIGRIDRWPGAAHFAGYPPALRGYGQIVGDFNAPDEDNWTFRLFHREDERARILAQLNAQMPEGGRRLSIAFFRQPGYGEPGTENLHNLGPGYYPRQIANMRLIGRGDLIDRLVHNRTGYLRAGEPVFRREFSRRVHVAEAPIEPEPGVPLRIGLDQGFKGAAVVAQFLPPFHWHVLAELHFPDERLMAAEFGRRLAALLDDARFRGLTVEAGWGDMAGEQGASQGAHENATWNLLVGRAAGFRVRPQRIGTNRLQPRLEAVRAALEFLEGGKPGLLIDPGCRFLIRGLEARYVWRDETDANGDRRKVPDKSLTEANVMDALQYLLLSESRGNGLSRLSPGPLARPGADPAPPTAWRPGGRPLPEPGLRTGWDVLNPYGG